MNEPKIRLVTALPLPRAQEIERVTDSMLDLASAMRVIALHRQTRCITAPQLGINLRLVVVVDGAWSAKLYNPIIGRYQNGVLEVYGLGLGKAPTRVVFSGDRATAVYDAIISLN